MKHLIIAIILIFSSVYPQSTVNHLFVPSGFTLESLSGYGYSKTIGNQANVASMNPASMDRFTSTSLGISYQYETNLAPGWIGNTGITRYKKSLPQSFGLILPYRDLRIGFGFTQKYNSSFIAQDIPITTVENPYGTGDFMNLTEESDVLRYSGMISYGVNDLINNKDRITLGLAVNYDRLNYHYSLGSKGYDPDRIISSHGSKITYSLGVTYSILNNSLFSLFYEKGLEFDQMTTDENVARGVYATSYLLYRNDNSRSKEPNRIHLGFDHSFTESSKLSSTLSYVAWNSTDNNKTDQLEASASYIHCLKSNLLVSMGLFYTDLNYNDNSLDMNGKFRSLFITAGVVYSISLIDLDLVVADSHLLSGANRKETIVKVSAGFHL